MAQRESGMNARKTTSSKYSGNDNQLVERVEIQQTPFTAIKADGKWFLTMGKYKLSKDFKTLREVQNDAKRADWFRVMAIINIMIDEAAAAKAKVQGTEASKEVVSSDNLNK